MSSYAWKSRLIILGLVASLGLLCCGRGLGPSAGTGGGAEDGGGDGDGDDGRGGGGAMTLSSVSPALAAKGATLTLIGTNFASGLSVSVGGVACTSLTIVSTTQATCVAGPRNMGTVDVVATQGSATGTLISSFTYRHYVYVADSTTGEVYAFSVHPTTGALTTVSGSPFPVAAGAQFLVADPLGKYLFVLGSTQSTLTAYTINAETGALGASLTLSLGANREIMAADPQGRFLYLSGDTSSEPEITSVLINRTSNALSVADTAGTTRESRTILVSNDGAHIYIGLDTGGVIAAGYSVNGSGELTEISGSPFGATSSMIGLITGFDSNFFWAAVPSLTVFLGLTRTASTGVLGSQGTSSGPASGVNSKGMSAHPSKRVLYTANITTNVVNSWTWSSGSSTLSNADNLTLVGSGVQQLAVEPSGQFGFLLEGTSKQVRPVVIDSTTGFPSTTGSPVAIGNTPQHLVVD